MSSKNPTNLKRQLSAILFADVVDYSRMIGEDDVSATLAVKERVKEFQRLSPDHSGRILRVEGDRVFMMFESSVAAVNFAIEMQKRLIEMNENADEDKRIIFRFGINMGEILIDNDDNGDVSGESINIAARIETFAAPGRICLSGRVYDEVSSKMSIGYEYLGAQKFKNIKDPIDVFQVHENPESAVLTSGLRRSTSMTTHIQVDPIVDQSVVVLPFVFQGGQTDDRWFADGLTEDVTTNLSRFQQFFVISRASAYVYQDGKVTPQQAASELGVRYVVSGSVRKAGPRIRITIQLQDVISNRTVWGEQYNRNIDDLFDLQDEITQIIVTATASKLEKSEIDRLKLNPPANMEAYGFLLQGQQHLFSYTRDGIERAGRFYDSALLNDAEYARAMAAKSRTINLAWRYNWVANPQSALIDATDLALNAIEIDQIDARGYGELGFAHLYSKDHDAALNAYERALKLNPNDADLMSDMADALAHSGRSEEAITLLEKAMRLNPFYPDQYVWHLGGAYFNLKQYEKAIETIKTMQNPTEGRRILAASYGHLGMKREAEQEVKRVLSAHPDFDVNHWASVQPDKFEDDVQHFLEGLKRAGF